MARIAAAYGDQLIWHVEEALLATKGDRLVEAAKFIPPPSKPTRREIAAFSVIVGRYGIPGERLCRNAIDDIHHPDERTRRKVVGPMRTELIVEDQPERIIR